MKLADRQLAVLLALLMSGILIHGYVPKTILKYVIVPIIKDKNKPVSDRGNNRPIRMSNIFTQIVEKYCTNGCKVIYICIYGVSRRTTYLIPSQLCFLW